MIRLMTIVFCISLFSCNSSSNTERDQKEHIRQVAEGVKKGEEKTLINKYNIKYDWDTLDYEYSIQYDRIISTQHQLISNPQIEDIYKKDETYNIRLQCGYSPNYLILQTSNASLINQILSEVSNNKHFDDLLIVASVDEIKKGLYELYAIPEYDDEAYIELEPSIAFYGKGQLIDVKILK